MTAGQWRERAGIVAVVLASLALLVYVAWGEMLRTTARFQDERLMARSEQVKSALETHLQAGLPLPQFAGFAALVAELKAGEPSLQAVRLEDPSGRGLFDSDAMVPDARLISLSVSNRFEVKGHLLLAVAADAHVQPVRSWMQGILLSAGLIAAGVILWLFRASRQADPLPSQRRGLLIGLALQTLVIVAVMWQVYSAGARSIAQTMADGLLSRVSSIYEDNLSLDDFSDVQAWLADYRNGIAQLVDVDVRINGELKFLSRDADSLLDTGALTRLSARRIVEASAPLDVAVSVGVPSAAVYTAIARNLKNFAALFLASVLIAMLLLRILHGYATSPEDQSDHQTDAQSAQAESLKASALLFLAVFCDQLSAAFLPQWVTQQAVASGFAQTASSWAFLAYFICFAVVLLPAERVVRQRGALAVLRAGTALIALAAFMLLLWPMFEVTLLARGLSGVGQGLVFVAVQALLLAWSRQAGSLGANTSIVFQFNAGMICGLALGSLLVVYLQPAGVFATVVAVAVFASVLSFSLRNPPTQWPAASNQDSAPVSADSLQSEERQPHLWWAAWRDPGFTLPALLVGIPSKAMMTGVVVYALPLLLSTSGLEREEIGQILLFYAVGVLACNQLINRLSPASSTLPWICGVAMLVSGGALLGLSVFSGWLSNVPGLYAAALGGLLLSVVVLGMAHGAVNAPVVTLVNRSRVAQAQGGGAVAILYRFVERIGHVAGPVLLAHVMVASSTAQQGLQLLATTLALMGFVFVVLSWRGSSPARPSLPVLLLLVCLAGAVLHGGSAHAADKATNKATDKAAEKAVTPVWLKLSDEALAHWQVRVDGADPDRIELQTSDVKRQMLGKSVLLLLPKPSAAYDVAVSKLLLIWHEKSAAPAVTVVFTHNMPAPTHAAMRSAQQQKTSLVLAVGSEATAFVHEHYRKGQLPLLSVCAKDPVLMKQVERYDIGSSTAMAYTSLNMPVDVQLRYLQMLSPQLQNIAIVVDRRNSSAWQTQTLPLEAAAQQAGMRVHRVVVDGSEPVGPQLRDAVPQAVSAMRSSDSLLRSSVIWITGSTAVFKHMQLINELAEQVPVLSAVPELVTGGDDSAVASIGVSFEENAHLAALYALKILRGEQRAGDLPVGLVSPPEIAINFRRARQTGLQLPLSFFEKAATVYNSQANLVRWRGSRIKVSKSEEFIHENR
jgi:putative ABC transport system substrate-binding protein